jgi:hypothetical protein
MVRRCVEVEWIGGGGLWVMGVGYNDLESWVDAMEYGIRRWRQKIAELVSGVYSVTLEGLLKGLLTMDCGRL